MKIAILGGTSLVAKDLTLAMCQHSSHHLVLFARRPHAVADWVAQEKLKNVTAANLADFNGTTVFDALINCIGVGNPRMTALLGPAIFDTTLSFDLQATAYQQQHPNCRHLFFSSGAAYGHEFERPVESDSQALLPLNSIGPENWYGMAKLYAEFRHRALSSLPIIDIRIFNYFSHSQDLSARFLMTDIVRAIQEDAVLQTSSDNIIRDYIDSSDLHQLVEKILVSPPVNLPVDCYSAAPVDKFSLLTAMKEKFGLRYELSNALAGLNATGLKPHYYSLNRRAEEFGYRPSLTSLESVCKQAYRLLI